MVTLHTAPTDLLTSSLVGSIRALLDTTFDGDFTDEDWEHAIGGTHVWVTDSSEPPRAFFETL